jgi:hypothetical protein
MANKETLVAIFVLEIEIYFPSYFVSRKITQHTVIERIGCCKPKMHKETSKIIDKKSPSGENKTELCLFEE